MKLNLTIFVLLPLAALLLAGCAGRATNGMVETHAKTNSVTIGDKLVVPPLPPGLSALPPAKTVAGEPSLAIIVPVKRTNSLAFLYPATSPIWWDIQSTTNFKLWKFETTNAFYGSPTNGHGQWIAVTNNGGNKFYRMFGHTNYI